MFKTTALLREGLQWQVLPKSWHCQKGGWGWIWPMPRFSGGFDKVYKGQTKVILTDKSKFAPKYDNIPPKGDQLPSISEQIHRNHFDPPKYVDIHAFYWLSRVAFTHFLSPNPPVCPNWGRFRKRLLLSLLPNRPSFIPTPSIPTSVASIQRRYPWLSYESINSPGQIVDAD